MKGIVVFLMFSYFIANIKMLELEQFKSTREFLTHVCTKIIFPAATVADGNQRTSLLLIQLLLGFPCGNPMDIIHRQ